MKRFLFSLFGLMLLPVFIALGVVSLLFAIMEVGASMLSSVFMAPLNGLSKQLDKLEKEKNDRAEHKEKKPRFVNLGGTVKMKSAVSQGKKNEN